MDCAARQIYGCFEMVSPPREQLNYNYICIAKNLNFDCSPFPTAKSDILSHRLQTVSAALNLERFASSARERNGTERISSQSEQPQNSVRTSLVPLSICLCEALACGVAGASSTLRRRAAPYGLGQSFLHFPAMHKHNNLFL